MVPILIQSFRLYKLMHRVELECICIGIYAKVVQMDDGLNRIRATKIKRENRDQSRKMCVAAINCYEEWDNLIHIDPSIDNEQMTHYMMKRHINATESS